MSGVFFVFIFFNKSVTWSPHSKKVRTQSWTAPVQPGFPACRSALDEMLLTRRTLVRTAGFGDSKVPGRECVGPPRALNVWNDSFQTQIFNYLFLLSVSCRASVGSSHGHRWCWGQRSRNAHWTVTVDDKRTNEKKRFWQSQHESGGLGDEVVLPPAPPDTDAQPSHRRRQVNKTLGLEFLQVFSCSVRLKSLFLSQSKLSGLQMASCQHVWTLRLILKEAGNCTSTWQVERAETFNLTPESGW